MQNKIHKAQYAPVFWFTGLPCAGKTTLSKALSEYLRSLNHQVCHLDGDEVRALLPNTGFSAEDRTIHLRTVGFAARKLSEHGIFVTASFVSPGEAQRKIVENLCPNFTVIYVSTPLSECEERDVKGMYKKARKGDIKDFTGIDAPFEPPASPDITIDTQGKGIQICLDEIIRFLNSHGKLDS
jgi:adenylyl-sulfate kinase